MSTTFNPYILDKVFKLVTIRPLGGIYPKLLAVMLGILKRAYGAPRDGYSIYPLTIADLDNLAKHLDPRSSQADPHNGHILEILEKIGCLEGGPANSPMEILSRQAVKIRGTFFDNTKRLAEAIPESLTERGNYCENEVHPEKLYVN